MAQDDSTYRGRKKVLLCYSMNPAFTPEQAEDLFSFLTRNKDFIESIELRAPVIAEEGRLESRVNQADKLLRK